MTGWTGELAVGHDRFVGYFATIEREGHLREFDRLTKDDDPQRPVDALLRWLVAQVVFTADDLDEALLTFADVADDDEQHSLGVARALSVIEALKQAASN